jgi:hypothetical protein
MNSLGSDERVFRELLTRFFTGKSALANATWAPRIDTLETIVRHDATIARDAFKVRRSGRIATSDQRAGKPEAAGQSERLRLIGFVNERCR